MLVDIQGPNECMLATIAALADVTLDKIKEEIKTVLKVFNTWDEVFFFSTASYWKTINYLVAKYKLKSIPTINDFVSGGNLLPSIPATGRGSITVAVRGSRLSHIMPFENGRIYDPVGRQPKETNRQFQYRRKHGETIKHYIKRMEEAGINNIIVIHCGVE